METNITLSPVNTDERKKLELRAGDRVRVWQKIEEKGKTRLQPFEGLVIARKHGAEQGGTFTVRKIASGVGVEKIFPLYSPRIDKIEVLGRSKVRRAKLYYIREKTAKQIRRKMKALAEFVPVAFDESAIRAAAAAEEEERKKQEEAATATEAEAKVAEGGQKEEAGGGEEATPTTEEDKTEKKGEEPGEEEVEALAEEEKK